MPKVSVYLPDELYRRARERGLKLSALTQAALEEALRDDANGPWIDAQRQRPRRVTSDFDTTELLGAVRDEFGA
jgi:post-segregation antitoxin (ccd killing protein)